jgi:hypothetical protein
VRRFSFAAASVAVAGLTLIVGACSSVPDITYGNGTTNGDTGPGGNDGGFDTTPGPDARDVVTDCKATGPENCDDGIDNDCNGVADCADPACNPTHQCVAAPPAGFDLTAVSDVRTVACENGYTDQFEIEMLPSDPKCECTCTDNGGTCTGGTGDVTISDSNTCAGGATATRALNRNQAACTAIPGGNVAVGNANARFEASVAATKPATCDANITLTGLTPISGRTCKPPSFATAGGCPPTQACVRRPPTNYAICATRTNPDAGPLPTCAAPYTLRRRGGFTINSSLNCDVAGCVCGNANCGGDFTIYDTANCGVGKSEVINAGQTCTGMSITGGGWTAVAYKSTATGGCSVTSSPNPQGSLDIPNESTVCCKP